LVLLAFGQSGVCERHQDYLDPSKFCSFCVDEESKEEAVIDCRAFADIDPPTLGDIDSPVSASIGQDSERDVYGEWKSCRLNPSKRLRRGRARQVECVIAIPEKRILQQIMQRSWFSPRHVEMVQNACRHGDRCVRGLSLALRCVVTVSVWNQDPDYDFGTNVPGFGHRRHVLHGVSLPKRLLDNHCQLSD
jgi:hypothetical protein